MSTPSPAIDTQQPAPAPSTVRTIKGYSVPGEGPSTLISVVTVLGLLLLWWVATHYGWIRDIFLPTPEKIFTSFGEAWKGEIQGGKPLSEHFWWSLYRVFAAFLLACVTAVPAGIAMGVSRIARGIFDPPIEFYRPLPPLAYLPLIIIWFGIDETRQDHPDLPRLLRAARDGGARRRAQRHHRADQRGVLDGRVASGR